MQKINREKAAQEVQEWLDKKKVLASVREANEDNAKILEEAISEGILTLQENGEFTQILNHPIGEVEKTTKLTFKARLNDKMLRPCLTGIKNNDGDGRLLAHIAALTGENRGLLELLDSTDKKISLAIVVFFL